MAGQAVVDFTKRIEVIMHKRIRTSVRIQI
jgi:hypothetical protein